MSKYWVRGFDTWLQVTGLLFGKKKRNDDDDLGMFAVNRIYYMTTRVRF